MTLKSPIKGMSLVKKLGELEKERRKILKELRQTPEYSLMYLKQMLDGFIAANVKNWYSKSNAKGALAYFKLISYEILPTTTLTTGPKYLRKSIPAKVDITKNKSVLIKLKLNWKLWDYNAIEITDHTEEINISLFNDLQTQILNGRILNTKFDEKYVIKATLTSKKKELEDQLKKIKDELATIK